MFRALALRQSKKDCSDEGLTLETSANTLFMAFSISTSTFCFYILYYTPCSQACKHTSLQFGINYRTTVPKMSGTILYLPSPPQELFNMISKQCGP